MKRTASTACVLAGLALAIACTGPGVELIASQPTRLRIATFNIEDLRSDELRDLNRPRVRAAAAVIQKMRPDIVLLNEVTYDQPGGPGWVEGEVAGSNGQIFAESFLAVSQGEGLEPLHFQAFVAPSNTGLASGFDFDNSEQVGPLPPLAPDSPYGNRLRQTPEERAYGADCWGFGTFPGQYAMVLLVRDGLRILETQARTFQELPWSRMPNALIPIDPETAKPWYSEEEWSVFRLSSKSHWDVPIQMPDGSIIHILASHPTPAGFDGDEKRNKKRNHDEIRFWSDYLSGADYIVDDSGRAGSLAEGEFFAILGDLNADTDEGNSIHDPIGTWLLAHPRINGEFVPQADSDADNAYPDHDPDDTSEWGLRIDYVLPSTNLKVLDGRVERPAPGATEVSDHFPVWIEVEFPTVRNPQS